MTAFQRLTILLLLVLVLAGCSKSASPPLPTVTPGGTALPAGTSVAATFPALPAQTPTAAGSPTPFTAFDVHPTVDSLKVRMGPGYLFDALILVNTDQTLTVQGKAPGGEWIFIKTADGVEGWVFAELLASDVDLQAIPLIQPQDVQEIKGRVTDAGGNPIQGVQFSIILGAGEDAPRTDAQTDATGQFFAFLPTSEGGTWTVSYTAIACKSNVWADTNCSTYKSGYTGVVEPNEQSVTLPQTGVLGFMWK